MKTTINLDDELYRKLVKEALDKYGNTKSLSLLINEKLKGKIPSKGFRSEEGVTDETFGIWKMKSTGSQYVRKLRKDWKKRDRVFSV